jgi:hypothetical protein
MLGQAPIQFEVQQVLMQALQRHLPTVMSDECRRARSVIQNRSCRQPFRMDARLHGNNGAVLFRRPR